MSGKPIDAAVAMLEALQERWCASTAGKPGARRIATFDPARGARGEDDFDNEVSATRRCASDLALAIERIRALTAAQQQACECRNCEVCDGREAIAAQQQGQAVYQVRMRGPFNAWIPVSKGEYDKAEGDKQIVYTAAPPSAPVGVEAICEQLVQDWKARERMPMMAWDFRGFAADAIRRFCAQQPAAALEQEEA